MALNSSHSALHVLDGPAAAVWIRCDGQRSAEDISGELSDLYGAPRDRVRADVASTLVHLRDIGLLDGGRSGLREHDEPGPVDGETPATPPASDPEASGQRRKRAAAGSRLGPFRAIDFDFHVVCDDEAMLAMLARVLRPLRTDAPAEAATYTIVAPNRPHPGELWIDDRLVLTHHVEYVLYSKLLWHINVAAVEHSSAGHLLLHAAAGESTAGTVLVSGAMDAGKSTLIAGLVLAGLRYLTDEIVALQPDTLALTPFPKSIFLDSGSWTVLPALNPSVPVEALHLQGSQWQIDPAAVGVAAAVNAQVVPPTVIIFPQFTDGASTRLTPVSGAEAVARLFPQRFAAGAHPARDFTALCTLARGAEAYQLVHGDLKSSVRAVLSLVAPPAV